MSLETRPINLKNALDMLNDRMCAPYPAIAHGFAIAAWNGDTVHGVITMYANEELCALHQLYTDGTALVGSLLYGSAWRAAKALGYKQITI